MPLSSRCSESTARVMVERALAIDTRAATHVCPIQYGT